MGKHSFSHSQRDSTAHFTFHKHHISFTNTNMSCPAVEHTLAPFVGQRRSRGFCRGRRTGQVNLLAAEFQVRLCCCGFWFAAPSCVSLLALLMLPAAFGPANPFVLLVCETNTNARAGEVTLDFHTDRFSVFSLMRFQERAREGG